MWASLDALRGRKFAGNGAKRRVEAGDSEGVGKMQNLFASGEFRLVANNRDLSEKSDAFVAASGSPGSFASLRMNQ
jgi:hypothetical protein